MIKVMLALLAVLAVVLVTLSAWRRSDKRACRAAWGDLVSLQPAAAPVFDPAMIDGLADPARRFFRFAIEPGTPLYTVAEISMHGELSLGDKAEPDYMPMHAEQVLAAPQGFIWKVRAGDTVWFSGSDGANEGASWSRFWLFGILPVARAGNNEDHARASFGRYVAEAVFWTPAALLPGDNVRWEGVDESTARVIMKHMGMQQAVDVTVDAGGRPRKVVLQRWSDANPSKTYQLQPFGGYLSQYKTFGGLRLPTRIEAGNFFETEDYFPFFKATVTSVRFPASAAD